jgi:hypothetical protein
VAGIAAVGCTGDGSSTPTSSSSTPVSTPSTPVVITPGEFRYANAGLVVTLELKTNVGTMVVDNGSDHDLPKPDLQVIDGTTGAEIQGKVLDSAAIPQGGSATFEVQFPRGVDEKSLGLVLLFFGSGSYGAFAPA